MSEKVLIEIEVDESGAVKDIKKVSDGLDDLDKKQGKATKSSKGFGLGLKGVGTALKGLGIIGIVVAAVSKLTELFLANQKVLDAVNKATTALSIVFEQFTKPIIDFTAALSDQTEKWDALGKVAGGIIDIALFPLKQTLLAIEAGIVLAQIAWEKSFFGDDDQETLDELNMKLLDVNKRIKENEEGLIEAGQAIVENFGEAIDEVTDLASGFADAVVEGYERIDLAAAASGATAIEEGKKALARLEIEQQAIRERADREAELQRRIRDDVRKTIDERIAANQRLGEILEEQTKNEQANINQRIGLLQQQQDLLGFQEERYLEILRLQTELEEVAARVTGFEAEQRTNINSLLREELEIKRGIKETDIETFQIQEQASIDILDNERKRIEEQLILEQQLYDRRKKLLKDRLKDEAEGTAQYQEIQNQIALIDSNYAANKKKLDKSLADFDIKQQDLVRESAQKNAQLVFGGLAALANENVELSKAINTASVLADSAAAAIGVFKSSTSLPEPAATINRVAQLAALAAQTVASLRQINSVSLGGGGGGQTAQGPSAPSVGQAINLVAPNQQFDALGQSITDGINGGVGRAYVVGSDVSGQQQLDREIARNGQFG